MAGGLYFFLLSFYVNTMGTKCEGNIRRIKRSFIKSVAGTKNWYFESMVNNVEKAAIQSSCGKLDITFVLISVPEVSFYSFGKRRGVYIQTEFCAKTIRHRRREVTTIICCQLNQMDS